MRGGVVIKDRIVAPEEIALLNFFRDELRWGECTVKVKDGLPVMVSRAREDVKLG